MVSAEILRHFTTDAGDSSHCYPLICMNHTVHHGFLIYSVCCHSDTTNANIQVICGNAVQCKFNQPQLNQSTIIIWANYIMLFKPHPSAMAFVYENGSSCFKSSSWMIDVNYSSMVLLVGSKRNESNRFQSWWFQIQCPRLSLTLWAVSAKQTAALGVFMP